MASHLVRSMTVIASTKQKLQQEDKQRKQSEVVDDVVVVVGVVGTVPSLPAHCLRVETYTNQGSLSSA